MRKNWSRTESRWRAGSGRQAEGRQAEPGMLGQHFSAGLPGWPRPRQARPPLQPSSQLPRLILTTLPRGEAEPEEPPRTGIGSLGSRLGGCDRGKMCSESVWNRSTTVNQKGGEQHILGVERSTREIQTRLLAKGVCGAYLCQFVHGHSHHPLLQPDLRATPRTKSGDQRGSGLAHEHPAPSGCAELGVPPLVLTVQEARWLGQNGISGVKRVRPFLIGKLSGSELTATTN